jgi:hypothetical protein
VPWWSVDDLKGLAAARVSPNSREIARVKDQLTVYLAVREVSPEYDNVFPLAVERHGHGGDVSGAFSASCGERRGVMILR